jgi:hypothetical protein
LRTGGKMFVGSTLAINIPYKLGPLSYHLVLVTLSDFYLFVLPLITMCEGNRYILYGLYLSPYTCHAFPITEFSLLTELLPRRFIMIFCVYVSRF